MSETPKPEIGAIGWTDLTVDNAESIRDFYASVTGWKLSPVSMGSYEDFNMCGPDSGQPMAGICHARGSNADLPPVWMIYITVEDVDSSATTCTEQGGEILVEPKDMGEMGRYCVIKDPAGAVAALFAYK
jgi:predicted enzyme related to lactoylglutathione lyase